MNIAIKKLWAEHLRSDWYDQNFEVDDQGGIPLRTVDDKWSPFGVLCNIHAQTFPEIADQEFDKKRYMDYEYMIPHQVALWVGLVNNGPYDSRIRIKPFTVVNPDGPRDTVTYHTIEEMAIAGVPFFMIADVIEVSL